MSDRKVIIIEDEPDLRENLTELLEFKEFEVQTYETGVEFLKHLDHIDAKIIFIDYQMPGVSGIETAARIKDKYPSLPVVLVTASSQPSTREEAARVKIDKIIIKPYSPDEIFNTVAQFVP